MRCYAPSKVQQNIAKFENGNVHNATQQKAQKEKIHNHGQVHQQVVNFEMINIDNQLDVFCNQNAALVQKMESTFMVVMVHRG